MSCRRPCPTSLGASGGLCLAYLRGAAYLAAHQDHEVASEFQKILGDRGIAGNEPIGALVDLETSRA
jgi:hypothetical protein